MPKPDIKTIRSLANLPGLPPGQAYSFKPAASLDQARAVCTRVGASEGYWLKNRVYFLLHAKTEAQA